MHAFSVELVDSDGAEVVLQTRGEEEQPVAFGGEFEVGRPPGLKPGTPLDFPVAVNSTPLPLDARPLRMAADDRRQVARGLDAAVHRAREEAQ